MKKIIFGLVAVAGLSFSTMAQTTIESEYVVLTEANGENTAYLMEDKATGEVVELVITNGEVKVMPGIRVNVKFVGESIIVTKGNGDVVTIQKRKKRLKKNRHKKKA